MLQGYELWVVDRQGRRAFRPAAARDASEVIGEARAILDADPDVREVDIDLAGERLVTVENAPPPSA
jgi:hypothetical protein